LYLAPPVLPHEFAVWRSIGEALLIGLLVGAQRESSRRDDGEDESRPGLRDFIVIAAAGGVCGLQQNAALTAVGGLSVLAILLLSKLRSGKGGMTTELAGTAVFCLSYVTTSPDFAAGEPMAIAVAVIMTLFLEARRRLHHFFRETITEVEFADTLRFLALIFVIFPVLPEDAYGPYHFFNPRQVWTFVILVSSISYIGYFLEKFLGATRGLWITSVLGGLASTTAATSAFAEDVREQPGRLLEFWKAATLANAIQFPRILILLGVISPALAGAAAAPLGAMTLAGLLLALLIRPSSRTAAGEQRRIKVRNPFSLGPALKFGAAFTAIVFLVKAASAHFGQGVLLLTAAVGGLLDVDAIAVTAAQMTNAGAVQASGAALAVLVALVANALFKTGLAWTAGTPAFAARIGASFIILLGAGALFIAFAP
jgi:uncharacterized membrane protein (DUF4010 family)